MQLIIEYTQCLDGIAVRQSSIAHGNAVIDACKANIQKYEQDLVTLNAEMQNKMESLEKEHIRNLVHEKTSELLMQKQECMAKLDKLAGEYASIKKMIESEPYTDFLAVMYQQLHNVQKMLKSKHISDEIPEQLFSAMTSSIEVKDSYTDREIAECIEDVKKLSSVPPTVISNAFSNKVLDVLTLDINALKTSKHITAKGRLVLYASYLGLIACILAFQPLAIVIPYSIGLVVTFAYNTKQYKNLIEYLMPYLRLSSVESYLKREIESRVACLRNQNLERLTNDYESCIKPVNQRISDLAGEIAQVQSNVTSGLSKEELREAANRSYNIQIKTTQDALEREKKNLRKNAMFVKDDERQITQLRNRLAELKQLLNDVLQPKEPGSSRMLTTKFFLGFAPDGSLIEFDYQGLATLVIYKGVDNSCTVPLIQMMLMQLLCSMSIVSLNLYITDTLFGCTAYSVFGPEKLKDRIHMCASSAVVNQTITHLYSLFSERNKKIRTEYKSLDAYNEAMLQRDSLTEDYHILFLQDPDTHTLESQEFRQLCSGGHLVGIIPIIFLSHSDLNEMIYNDASAKILNDFLCHISDRIYSFDGESLDLSFEGNAIKEEISKTILRRKK